MSSPFGRSRGRGTRGRKFYGNWRGGSSGSRSSHTRDPLETQPMGDLLEKIAFSDVQSSTRSEDVVPTIKDCKYIASYNWLNRNTPTIVVPGSPPAWTPLQAPPQLQQDSGDYYRDTNSARYPLFPTEPGIQAVFALHPDFEAMAVDVVGCGSTLGNLLRFADTVERSFRFNVEVIADTVFLVRKENSPTELIPDVHGYGHTFPEAYTSWDADVIGSVSHQRLITYDFGGLRCLVRFESDGYLKDKAVSESDRPTTAAGLATPSDDADVSSLLQATETISVSEVATASGADLKIKLAGREIPQSAVFDLKTRAAHKETNMDMDEVYRRLWISQTPNSIIAYHNSGQFNKISVQDVQLDIEEWEERHRRLVHRFYTTLKQLIDIAKQSRCRKVEVRRIGAGPLEIRKLIGGAWSALSPDMKARWTGNPVPEDEQEDKETVADAGEDEGVDLDDYLKF